MFRFHWPKTTRSGPSAKQLRHASLLLTPLEARDVPAVIVNGSLFGDADGDQDVDTSDFQAFQASYPTKSSSPTYRSSFDWDSNGAVDVNDLSKLLANYNAPTAAGPGTSIQAKLSHGSLTIRGTATDTLLIAATGTSSGAVTFEVWDGTRLVGTFPVTGDLIVRLQGHADTVDVDLNGQTLAGNVSIDFGRTLGALSEPTSIYGGKVGGWVRLNDGSGQETWNIGKQSVGENLVVGGDVRVIGQKTNSTGPGDSLLVTADSVIGGSLKTSKIENVLNGEAGANATVLGRTVVNATNSAQPLAFMNFGEMAQDVRATGSKFGNTIIFGDGITADSGRAGESVNLSLRNGDSVSSIEMSPGSVVQSKLWIFTGDAADVVSLAGTAEDLALQLNDVDNMVAFTGVVHRGMTIRTGDGNDDVSPFTGTVGAQLTLGLGNGNNVATLAGNLTNTIVKFTGGAGADNVTLVGASRMLRVFLNHGLDSLDLSLATFHSASLDFGDDQVVDNYLPPLSTQRVVVRRT
jgi:hypothetical protein